jgi:hypothetical protein
LETLVLYLDDDNDMDQIEIKNEIEIEIETKISRKDKNLILDLLFSTRVMLVLKQTGNTCFELFRDPVNVRVIQVIEISP